MFIKISIKCHWGHVTRKSCLASIVTIHTFFITFCQSMVLAEIRKIQIIKRLTSSHMVFHFPVGVPHKIFHFPVGVNNVTIARQQINYYSRQCKNTFPTFRFTNWYQHLHSQISYLSLDLHQSRNLYYPTAQDSGVPLKMALQIDIGNGIM